MIFKTLNLYFKSDCCNKEQSGGDSVSLVETIADFLAPLNRLKMMTSKNFHEICITLKPKFHYIKYQDIHNEMKLKISKWLKKDTDIYYFTPEFNKSGIIHWHGLIWCESVERINEFKRSFNRRYGRTTGKIVYNMDNYITYISKDQKDLRIIKPFWKITQWGVKEDECGSTLAAMRTGDPL